MSDESSDNEQTWWMPAGRPEPAEPEEPADLAGRIRPIGPPSLRSWSRRPYVVTGVAVAALLGGAGAALAATNSPPSGASLSAVVASIRSPIRRATAMKAKNSAPAVAIAASA